MSDAKAKAPAKPQAPSAAVPGTSSTAVTKQDKAVGDLIASARTPQERTRLYEIATELEKAKALRRVSNLIATMEWGAKLTEAGRAAFGRYCLELGGDPLRHVDILSGRPFVNGTYYRDLVAANEKFQHADDPVWIHDDPRLQLCVLCGEKFLDKPEHGHGNDRVTEENRKRMDERIARAVARVEENVPDTDVADCIVRLHYSDGRGPFKGVGRARGGNVTRKRKDGSTYTVSADPVGQESARETAETRAWREAGEKSEPAWFRNHPRLKEAESQMIELRTSGRLMEPEPEPPAPVVGDEPPRIAAGSLEIPGDENGAPEAPAEPTEEPEERHNPTKVCSIEGPHPRSVCGFHKKAT